MALFIAAGCLLATGCARTAASGTAIATTAPSASASSQPSSSAQMICGPEIRRNIAAALGLATPPLPRGSWADHRYTCRYQLADGTLSLSVEESSTPATAQAYFAGLRQRLGPSQPLSGLVGLGLPGFETEEGNAVLVKDAKTLQVDATGLSGDLGPQHETKMGFAYQLATDVLGCWTGSS